ncbi:MAG: hypothetical protein QM766_24715 [Burkholderiaceae bacterium]
MGAGIVDDRRIGDGLIDGIHADHRSVIDRGLADPGGPIDRGPFDHGFIGYRPIDRGFIDHCRVDHLFAVRRAIDRHTGGNLVVFAGRIATTRMATNRMATNRITGNRMTASCITGSHIAASRITSGRIRPRRIAVVRAIRLRAPIRVALRIDLPDPFADLPQVGAQAFGDQGHELRRHAGEARPAIELGNQRRDLRQFHRPGEERDHLVNPVLECRAIVGEEFAAGRSLQERNEQRGQVVGPAQPQRIGDGRAALDRRGQVVAELVRSGAQEQRFEQAGGSPIQAFEPPFGQSLVDPQRDAGRQASGAGSPGFAVETRCRGR